MANYLKDEDLRAEVIECQATGIVTPKLAEYFTLIANNLVKVYKYTDQQDKEDVIATAILIMCERYHRFDPKKIVRPATETEPAVYANCFSYFTQIALNGLRTGWNYVAGHKKFTSSIDAVFEESV